MPEASMTQYFYDTPQLGLTWNADKMEQVSTWRVRLRTEDQDSSQAKVIDSKENKISTPVAKPGRYIASIEALDKNGEVMGSAQSQAVTVAVAPPLTAPQFLPAEGSLQATMDGKSQLEWSKVDGAKEYWLTIRKNGKELRKAKYVSNSTSLKNLLPGEYEVEISALDSHGRNSEVNPARKLVVPDKSNLRAPTLKKIKVN
jgi:predicted phage tail protein